MFDPLSKTTMSSELLKHLGYVWGENKDFIFLF